MHPTFLLWMKTTDYTYVTGDQNQFAIIHINCLGSSTGRVFYICTVGNKFASKAGHNCLSEPYNDVVVICVDILFCMCFY